MTPIADGCVMSNRCAAHAQPRARDGGDRDFARFPVKHGRSADVAQPGAAASVVDSKRRHLCSSLGDEGSLMSRAVASDVERFSAQRMIRRRAAHIFVGDRSSRRTSLSLFDRALTSTTSISPLIRPIAAERDVWSASCSTLDRRYACSRSRVRSSRRSIGRSRPSGSLTLGSRTDVAEAYIDFFARSGATLADSDQELCEQTRGQQQTCRWRPPA